MFNQDLLDESDDIVRTACNVLTQSLSKGVLPNRPCMGSLSVAGTHHLSNRPDGSRVSSDDEGFEETVLRDSHESEKTRRFAEFRDSIDARLPVLKDAQEGASRGSNAEEDFQHIIIEVKHLLLFAGQVSRIFHDQE